MTRLIPEQAFRLGFSYVGTEHILLAILAHGDGRARTMLIALGADEEMLRGQLAAKLTDQLAARIRVAEI
jgi:ATP-dependent Clp protease ATP-binding subunit ClpA